MSEYNKYQPDIIHRFKYCPDCGVELEYFFFKD